MKTIPKILALAALVGVALPLAATAGAVAMADVGVSVSVGQPNFYGRLDIGDFPAPRVVYRQPVMVERGRMDSGRDPIYLRVPASHRRHWSRNCSRYDACGQQVYFVQDRWYNNVYAPQYRERHDNRGHHRGHRRDDRRDDGNDGRNDGDHRDHDHNDDHNDHGGG